MTREPAPTIASGVYVRLPGRSTTHTANERGQRTNCGRALPAEGRFLAIPAEAVALDSVCLRCAERDWTLLRARHLA
jgi:hypothetical protein